jgi:hypothetical protein
MGKGKWTSEPMIFSAIVGYAFEDTIRIQYWGSNIIGVTALPVMRTVLTIARGRQVRRSILCPSCSSSLRHERLGHTIREATVVEGAPFFGYCSVHTAYRSAPRWVLSSRVHALVLHKVITARKRLATFTYESCKKTK